MKRGKVLKLREEVWCRPLPDDDLEICLIPSEAGDTVMSAFTGAGSSVKDRVVCRDVFVKFRNYLEDDGSEVENTIETRLELFAVAAIRQAVYERLNEAHNAISQGEAVAASD